ncbi:MAG: LamG domain-containing protein, partial [Ktedonobacteraceae bacterium]
PSPTFTPTPTPTPSPTLTPTPTPLPLLNGIIGYWKFDEASAWVNDCTTLTVIDSSSNNNNGKSCIAGSGPTAAVTGRLGFARNFSGTGSYVKIASANTLNFTTGQDFSYTLWFQRSGSTTSSFLFAKGAGGSSDVGYAFVLTNGATPTAILSKTGETSRLIMKGTAITDNNWHQITVTYQRSGLGILYQDGVQTASIDVSSYNTDLSNTKALAIGCNSGGSTCFAGLLDDVRLYNRVLSAQEAAQLAQGL